MALSTLRDPHAATAERTRALVKKLVDPNTQQASFERLARLASKKFQHALQYAKSEALRDAELLDPD
eukprot:3082826-Prymnesium_polylepis.1